MRIEIHIKEEIWIIKVKIIEEKFIKKVSMFQLKSTTAWIEDRCWGGRYNLILQLTTDCHLHPVVQHCNDIVIKDSIESFKGTPYQ